MDMAKAFAAILAGTILLCLSGAAQAHKPLLSVGDDSDGTIAIEAGFSDGSSAAGHKIILKNEKTGEVISEHRVGEDGTLQLKKPSVPYTVTLDAGEGHVVTKPGPAPSESEKAPASGKSEAPSTEPASPAQQGTASPELPQPQPAGAQVLPAATVKPDPAPRMSGEISPGAVMAFKMMITAQIVTATALIVLLAVIAYFIGYTMGRRERTADPNRR